MLKAEFYWTHDIDDLAIESRPFLTPKLDSTSETEMIVMMDKDAKTWISEYKKTI